MHTIVYPVSGMRGVHCRHAIEDVRVDLLARTVAVTGQVTQDEPARKGDS